MILFLSKQNEEKMKEALNSEVREEKYTHTHLTTPLAELFRASDTKHTTQLLIITTGQRQTSWQFTIIILAEKLNQGQPGTNSTRGQSESSTQDLRVSTEASAITTGPHCLGNNAGHNNYGSQQTGPKFTKKEKSRSEQKMYQEEGVILWFERSELIKILTGF